MTTTSTNLVRLYPNTEMRQALDELCDYRRFCWNKGLETWNTMYQASLTSDEAPKPGRFNVCNALVAAKEDWQYRLSSRVLQKAIADLAVKTSTTKLNLIEANPNSSLKERHVKALKQIALEL